MLSYTSIFDLNVLLYTYLSTYNFVMLLFMWILTTRITTDIKTIYSFSKVSFDSFSTFSITVLLLSVAGVPPFIGFFTKLFLLILVTNSYLSFLYLPLFLVFFTALYFYVQNIKFIHQSDKKSNTKTSLVKSHVAQINVVVVSIFVVVFGVYFMDDILNYMSWLFS